MKFHLARHGETPFNAGRAFTGSGPDPQWQATLPAGAARLDGLEIARAGEHRARVKAGRRRSRGTGGPALKTRRPRGRQASPGTP